MARDSSVNGRWWYDEELSTPKALTDIDAELDAFDRSKWKERVNKVARERDTPVSFDWEDKGPINRFR